MRSTDGQHFIALDHVRGGAAFMVFVWHFAHMGSTAGFPVAYADSPALPFALLDEGHTGVALFMTLSGYLFAKLLSGKPINYAAFFYNRALRLLPLLLVVLCLGWAISGGGPRMFLSQLVRGLTLPTLPNGGWSITVEFHFYLLLPALFALFARGTGAVAMALVGVIAARALLYLDSGEIQSLSYWTIVGRIDQFMLGMLAYHLRHLLRGQHVIAGSALVAFAGFYWLFNAAGGFYGTGNSPLWIILPTVEGAAYGVLIGWYDNSFNPRGTGASWVLCKAGEYSYSVYLLHFFFVQQAAAWTHANIADLSNFYTAALFAVPFFAITVGLGHFTYRCVERPFLRLRKPYSPPQLEMNASVGGVKLAE